jgi:hypothetical protein
VYIWDAPSGTYQINKYKGSDRLISLTFAQLVITVEQILTQI